ncbi:hypothetical protein B0H21DRAFT_751037 [Amylocystis lapponica]|nr:hypothetical protein B0H21DRAFT_751037 [Amylocystis lapponica]
MPEYVYALHDFSPENPDEVSFKVGERIEVIEKDDLYGDGWWQGRNPFGKVGLFPQSYTTSNAPSSSITFPNHTASSSSTDVPSSQGAPSGLQALREEAESRASDNGSTSHALAKVHQRQASEEMMKATMTDVQKAIEQLGRRDHDDDEDGLGWHKGAREKLALRAQQENEERQAREAAESSAPSTPLRSVAPPIDVEMSDESEDEDDLRHRRSPRRHSDGALNRQPHILEEDEEEGETVDYSGPPHPVITVDKARSPQRHSSLESAAHIIPSEDFIVPSPVVDETDLPTATVERTSFTEPSPVPSSVTLPARLAASELSEDLSPTEPIIPEPIPMSMGGIAILEKAAAAASTSEPAPAPPIASTSSTIRVTEQFPFSASSALPSPTTSSSAGSLGYSSAGIQQALTPATTAMSFKSGTGTPLASQHERSLMGSPNGAKKLSENPSEWTMEEVVDWLKSKGFDQSVCDKFVEQEITGDVLLELDANILKTEIGITAFGKRVRIANAITELRRPPSISESEHPQPVMTPRSQTQSLLYSHSHSASMQSSGQQSWANSPLYPSQGFSPALSNGIASATSVESPPHTGDLPASPSGRNGWRESDRTAVSATAAESEQAKAAVGLGIGLPTNGKEPKSRPAQLVLSPSPSEGALGLKAVGGDRTPGAADEDRTALSEGETSHAPESSKGKRRRLFGRSADSGSLKKSNSIRDFAINGSKDAITPVTPPSASGSPTDTKNGGTEEDTGTRRQARGRRSVDASKPSDRLSLFGGTFSGTIGKARKPPPRLSATTDKVEPEKHSTSTFSRMREKRSTSRPSTSDGHSYKEKEKKGKEVSPIKEVKETKTKESKDPSLLRKRTASAAEVPSRSNALAGSDRPGPTLKPGQSILAQIGTPDHNGWMRKKGDRYNAWKLRYFVLKGPHLYCLRSNDTSETKIKGYINIVGYKVVADENADPGRYGFRIVHDTDKTHYFSSEEQSIIREWMKALMKATISRDYTNPVVSSCNVPTIPLTVAQAMNPAPRPPSPTAREATQKALRRENPNQLSSRDAQVLLMGVPAKEKTPTGERTRLESFFTNDTLSTNGTEPPLTAKSFSPKTAAPPRPSREMRRLNSSDTQPVDPSLLEWANSHLPSSLHVEDTGGPLSSGLALLRLAENIKGKPSVPPVPDSAFPTSQNDEKLDGLFRLFDYLLDNDVKMGTVSINDIRMGKREKIAQLLRAMKSWEEKRKAAQSIGKGSPHPAFYAMAGPVNYF